MKNIFTFILIVFLASCTTTHGGFNYDRENSCEINYGHNGISVIVDGNNIIVKNNRMIEFNKVLTIRTEDKNYSTIGRYFNSAESLQLIESLKKSEKVYLEWKDLDLGLMSSNKIHRNIINVTGFETKFNECMVEQKSRNEKTTH